MNLFLFFFPSNTRDMETILLTLLAFVIFLALGALELYLRDESNTPYHTDHTVVYSPYFDKNAKPDKSTKPTKTIVPTRIFVSEPDWYVSTKYMFISAEAKAEYLQSATWYNLRALTLSRAGNKCEHCGSTNSLQCHHTSYEWLSEGGENELADLAILCSFCHNRIHEIAGYDRTTKYPISLLK